MASKPADLIKNFQSFLQQVASHTTSSHPTLNMNGGAAWPTTSTDIVGNNVNGKAGYFGFSRNNGNKWHAGIDIGNTVGADVFAFADGTVTRASWQNNSNHNQGFGQRIVIEHILKANNGTVIKLYTVYGHLSSMSVAKDAKVNKGQIIGKVGRTGNANNVPNTHLHFEIRVDSYPGNSRNNISPNSLFDFESRVITFINCLTSGSVCAVPTTHIKNQ